MRAHDGTLRRDVPVTVLFALYSGMLDQALNLVQRRELGSEQAAAWVATIFLNGAAAGHS